MNNVCIDSLIERLEKKKIYISSGKEFFIENKSNENSFRLYIAKLTKDKIKLGMQIILDEIARSGVMIHGQQFNSNRA
jgi:DNA-binding transcriptional MocR family regulator